MTRTLTPPSAARDAVTEWIVCNGALRDVRRGRVTCPLIARRVPLATCLDCHHLAEAWNDRDLDDPCSTGPSLS